MKLTENQKRKVLRIISERAGELLDELKKDYMQNMADDMEKKFEILREFDVLKKRVWSYK